jgi:hypothetical protein
MFAVYQVETHFKYEHFSEIVHITQSTTALRQQLHSGICKQSHREVLMILG